MPERGAATADLPLIRAAAREAGRIAVRHWTEGAASWEKPGGQGPVTAADLEVDAYLKRILTSARPGYGWLSEESRDDPYRLTKSRVFIVDPIDGTRAFATGDRTWAVSVAVVEDGQPVAACVHLPLRQLTYTAAAGAGALLHDQPLTASDARLPDAVMLANRATMDARHWPGGVPKMSRDFRSSLAYRLSLVGEGRFDAMATFRETWEWDVAAGTLIALEAGATVTDSHGERLTFNTQDRHSPGILAAGAELHAELLTRATDRG